MGSFPLPCWIDIVPVSSPCWQPWLSKQVQPSIVDHPDLDQHTANKQTRPSLAAEMIFTHGSNWHKLHGMSPDVVVSGTESRFIFVNKTFTNCHINMKFTQVYTHKRNSLYINKESVNIIYYVSDVKNFRYFNTYTTKWKGYSGTTSVFYICCINYCSGVPLPALHSI